MSDTRTDLEELGDLCLSYLMPPTYKGGSWTLDPDKLATAILAAGFARSTPRPSTIAVAHTPEEIKAAFDMWQDIGFMKPTDLEYTDDGVTHLASNVNVTPLPEWMPVELRPDIGEDRL